MTTVAAVCFVLRWINGLGGVTLIVVMLSRHRQWACLPVWLRFYANGLMMMTVAAAYGSFEALWLELGPAVRVPVTTVALAWVAVGVKL